MARPREFDEDQVLDAAMRLFWLRGYEAVSLDDLLEVMGIARGSFYKAFRSKREVYAAALDRYDRTIVDGAVTMLSDPAGGDGPARVRRFLFSAADPIDRNDDRRGCFLCNAAVDRALLDPGTGKKVTGMMRRIEAAIAAALAEAAGSAEGGMTRAAETAQHLLTAYMGLQVLARAGYPAEELRRIAKAQAPRSFGASGALQDTVSNRKMQ